MANYESKFITHLKKERRELVKMKEMADIMRDKTNSIHYQNQIDMNDEAVKAIVNEGGNNV